MDFATVKNELSGWGRYPRVTSSIVRPKDIEEAKPPSRGCMISRGQGRSYGDAALCTKGVVMLTEALNGIVEPDYSSGSVLVEGGIGLAALLEVCVPRGWFPFVVPGTKFVSVGGCIAADVHGKNHHRDGAFGAHVSGLDLVLANGDSLSCSATENAEVFWATVGGMGLTGIITRARLELRRIESAYMVVQHIVARDLDSALSILEGDAWDDQYTVAWLDSLAGGKRLGRGVMMRGHHAALAELAPGIKNPLGIKARGALNVPFDLPSYFLNRLTAGAFNECYYRMQSARVKPFVTDYDAYFFPLDGLGNWNRLYGRRGFLQYQCVFPLKESPRGLQSVLELVSESRMRCFLTTLKRFGPQGEGLLSFPMAGYTLALDFPIGDSSLFELLIGLDEIVLKFGGRVYLAKDARLSPESFRAMYGNFGQWQRVKTAIDPDNRFMSDLGRRLGMCAHA